MEICILQLALHCYNKKNACIVGTKANNLWGIGIVVIADVLDVEEEEKEEEHDVCNNDGRRISMTTAMMGV